MSKKAEFECYLHWEGIKRGETTAGSYDVYLGVYKTEETDDELEDDYVTSELDDETSDDALCYLKEYADKVTSSVVKLTRIKTSGKGLKKVVERKNSFELDISNLIGGLFVNKPNKVNPPHLSLRSTMLSEKIISDKIKTICLTDVRGFKEIHIRPEFFDRHLNAKEVKSGKALFNDFNNIWSYIHRTDGPALITTVKDNNKLYVVDGNILVPEVNDPNGPNRLDQDLIDLIEERGRSKKNVVD